MPKIYIEGYQTVKKNLSLLYKFKVKNIFTSALGIRADDLFIFWVAYQVERHKSKLIIYQHGGYGVLKFFNQDHELSIAINLLIGDSLNNKKILNLVF